MKRITIKKLREARKRKLKEDRTLELNDLRYKDSYDEFLDEEGPINVGGFKLWPSRILASTDPIAYREGYMDYIDSMDWSEEDDDSNEW